MHVGSRFGSHLSRRFRKLTDIERPATCAASTGSLAVPASMASRLQVPASTVKRYLDLLDLMFVTRRIPAWSSNLATRAVATPKLLLTDSGLAAHLTGLSLRRAHGSPPPRSAHLIETFVLGELARQITFADQPVRLRHYRDRDHYEVDAVLEAPSGEVIAFESKLMKCPVRRSATSSDSPGDSATS